MKLSRHGLWILIGAALLYVLVLPRTPVGYTLDDALYILGAQSLLSGHYANLQLPWHPALTDPLPGFSLLISSGVAAVEPHWFYLKAIPLMLTLFSGLMLWFLLESWISADARAAVLALFALNPVTVNFAGLVVSEPAFLFLVLFVFLQLDALTESGRTAPALGLGGLLVWAAVMRPQGILLAVSVGIALMVTRRWRAFSISLGLTGLGVGGVLMRNVIAAHELTGYMSHWRATLPDLLHHPLTLVHNMVQVTRTLLQDTLLAWPSAWILGGAAAVLAAAAVITGAFRFSTASTPERMTRLAVCLFTGLYFTVQLFWSAVDIHYLYPILPFVLLFAVLGVESLFSHHTRKALIFGALLSGVLLRYLFCDARLIPGVSQPALTLPRETYSWIAAHLPPKSFLYTPAAPTVRLYTGIYAMYGVPIADPETFRYDLLKKGVTHVLFQSVDLLSFGTTSERNRTWARTQVWVASSPEAYNPIYENPTEFTRLYAVRSDPHFLQAYELYQLSYEDMQAGRPKDARTHLEQALRLAPDNPGMLHAYGMMLSLSGEKVRGEAYLQRAAKARRL